MREIDLIPIRLHKGEPTWEIIDELLEMIDASPSEEEIEARVKEAEEYAYDNGDTAGYAEGFDDGLGYQRPRGGLLRWVRGRKEDG